MLRTQFLQGIKAKKKHMQTSESGLVLNPEWPHLGASPDGKVQCDCRGQGILEIKCPYCHYHDVVDSVASEK